MYTTTVNKNVATSLDFNYSSSVAISGAAKYSVNQSVPTGTTGALVNFGFSTVSGKFLGLASVSGPLELRMGSKTVPTNTFTLLPGQNVIIDNIGNAVDTLGGSLQSFSLLYVYNSGTVASTLRMDSLLDPTPDI
jgi:hypothetical protein